MPQIDRTEEFKAWVAKQEPEREYNYVDNDNCAFAQFLRAAEIPFSDVAAYQWFSPDGSANPIPYAVEEALSAYDGRQPNGGRTFGALAERLAKIPA